MILQQKLIFLIIFSISQITFSQSYSIPPTKYEKIFESIQNRGLERGVDLKKELSNMFYNGYPVEWKSEYIQMVDSITISGKESTIGIVIRDSINYTWEQGWYFKGIIQLENNIFTDTNIAEFVIAHEIGHWFNLQHSCRELNIIPPINTDCLNIMAPIQITFKGDLNYDIRYSSIENDKIWDLYFDKIKNKLQLIETWRSRHKDIYKNRKNL